MRLGVHDGDAVDEPCLEPHVVADENHGDAHALLDVEQRLADDVARPRRAFGRLVGDDERRQGNRHCDADVCFMPPLNSCGYMS